MAKGRKVQAKHPRKEEGNAEPQEKDMPEPTGEENKAKDARLQKSIAAKTKMLEDLVELGDGGSEVTEMLKNQIKEASSEREVLRTTTQRIEASASRLQSLTKENDEIANPINNMQKKYTETTENIQKAKALLDQLQAQHQEETQKSQQESTKQQVDPGLLQPALQRGDRQLFKLLKGYDLPSNVVIIKQEPDQPIPPEQKARLKQARATSAVLTAGAAATLGGQSSSSSSTLLGQEVQNGQKRTIQEATPCFNIHDWDEEAEMKDEMKQEAFPPESNQNTAS
eukprot:TRINITY_DN24547_c0_g1_i2.p2 TRINITY_DN24547_c0_g1~~TRINITY_DN24547_c0_g1_i2.p2  ORF type:complete len:283 (-),score=92.49 TRINITY_DN24547_c0_g1_i2:223-1071(-)